MKIERMPLVSLRTETGADLHRVRDVRGDDLKKLISGAVVRFVVADIGRPLRWIPEKERFSFWKSDVQAHISAGEKKSLDDFPDGYLYFASEWHSDLSSEVYVLLEKQH